jgi:predicted methyltransferase
MVTIIWITINLMLTLNVMTVLLSKLTVENNHKLDGYSEVDGNPDDSFTMKLMVGNNHQLDGYSELDGNPDDSFTIKVDS